VRRRAVGFKPKRFRHLQLPPSLPSAPRGAIDGPGFGTGATAILAPRAAGTTPNPIHPMRTLASLALVALASLSACRQNGVYINGISFGDWEQTEVRTDDHALSIDGAVVIDIATSYGDVAIVASDDHSPRVVATLTAGAPSRSVADELLARTRVEVVNDGDVVRVRLVTDPREGEVSNNIERGTVAVDFVLHVPRGMDVVVDCGSGDIDVAGGVGAAQLETGYGDVELEGAEGDVTASSGSGSVSVRDIEGGLVHLRSNYGDVEADGVDANILRMKSGSGDVSLANARAEGIELGTSYGNVSARTVAGSLSAESGSGSVAINAFEGAAEVSSGYGDVDVEGVFTSVVARAGSGDVAVVAQAGSEVSTSWRIESSYGDVDLFAPAGFACKLDARTSYGDIECGYPLTIEAGVKSDERLAGSINGGAGLVELSSGSGDVRLRVR